tara:strand:+ start:23826 stop:27311 length:3486 start_codon:yes stop_codon:yes gene_type:complete
MPSQCEINNKNIIALENNDRVSEEGYKALTNFVDINESLNVDINEEFTQEQVVDEKSLDEAILKIVERTYGKKSERILLAHKIYALIAGTSLSEDMMFEFIVTHLPHGLKVGRKTGEIDPDTGMPIRAGIDLTQFPISSLKLFMGQALKVITAVNPDSAAYASFGGIWSAIKTPTALKWKEPTGAFYDVSKNVRDYSRFVSSRINMFMDNIDELKSWIKKYNKGKDKDEKLTIPSIAMNDILENLSNFSAVRRGESSDRHVERLFHMYMMGWAYIDPETNQFMVYEDWNIVLEERMGRDGPYTTAKRYDETGDLVYNFQNPVPLSKFKDGEWNVQFNAKDFKKFQHLTQQARIIDDAVFEYMAIEFQESVDTLLGSLAKSFPALNREQLHTLFFASESKKAKDIFTALNVKEKALFKELKSTFGMYVNDDIVIANGSKVEKKARHWPIMYDVNVFKMMLDNMISQFQSAANKLQKKIDKTDISSAKKKLQVELESYEAKLAYAENVRDNMDGYHRDYSHNSLIPFSKDNKYFKRISNAYDIRSGRMDTGVYYDYLKHVMSAIERNFLSATLVEGVDKAPSPAVKRTMINLFKVPFGDPTTEGFMGMTVEQQSNIINMITPDFLYSKSPKELQEDYRVFAAYLTGAYLSGTGSPITNMSAQFENIYDFGYDVFQQAFQDYYSDQKIPGRNITKGEAIRKLIQRSGITEFSDFFSKAMVNGIIGIQLENDIADRILGEMLIFWDATGKGPWKGLKRILKGKRKTKQHIAYTTMMDNILKLLESSDLYETNLENIIILDESRVNKRKNRVKRDKRMAAVNKLVQFAINKEYEFKHALKNVPVSKFKKHVGGPIKDLALTIGQLYAQISKHQFNLTMSDTEAAIRSFSFVIGANRAWVHGVIPNDVHWWEYTKEEDIQKLLSIGSEYNYFVNFGLSTQDVGRYNWNGWGNLMGKFKYWSQQKWGKDMRRWNYAYMSLKRNQKVQNHKWDGIAIAKLLGHLFDPRISKTRGTARRISNPEVQAFRVWFWTQGIATMMFDIFIRGPFRVPILSRYAYGKMGFGGQLRNFGSDMLSWIFLFPTLIARAWLLGDEPPEDDDLMKEFTFYSRKLFLGYVPMMGFDFIISMIMALQDRYKSAFDRFPVPLPPPVEKELKYIIKEVGEIEDY